MIWAIVLLVFVLFWTLFCAPFVNQRRDQEEAIFKNALNHDDKKDTEIVTMRSRDHS